MPKVARQVLAQKLDSSFAKNEEQKRELNGNYQEEARLKRGDSQVFGMPLRIVVGHGTQMKADELRLH